MVPYVLPARAPLLTLLVLAWLLPASAGAVLYDFQDQTPEFPPNVCGVSFVNGDYRAYVWDTGLLEDQIGVRRDPSGDLFDALPMEIAFTRRQSLVRMGAGHIEVGGAPVPAILRAFDTGGLLVDSAAGMVGDQPLTVLEVSTAGAVITRVTLTLSEGDASVGVLRSTEAIDNLEISDAASCGPDTVDPSIQILWPPSGMVVMSSGVGLVASLQDDIGLWTLTWTVDHADGSQLVLDPAGGLIPQPPTGATAWLSGSLGPPPTPVIGNLFEIGENTLTATACDQAGNCSSDVASVDAILPEPGLNLFMRAVEVNQATQDEISVNPVRDTIEFQDSYPGVPLIARKTTAVRAYPGSEGTAFPWTVPVLLHGRDPGTGGDLPGSPLGPIQAVVPPGDAFNPGSRLQGALFLLPRSWTDVGTIELRAQVNPPRVLGAAGVPVCPTCPVGVDECTGCVDLGNLMRVVDVGFQDPPRPGLRLQPLPLAHTTIAGQVPVSLSPAVQGYLNATYPLSDDPLQSPPALQIEPDHAPVISSAGGCNGLLRRVRDANPVPPSLNLSLFTVLGTISQTPFSNCTGVAYRPGLHAWAVQGDGGPTSAQEIGHNRGLVHASNAHGESTGGAAEGWPFAHGSIGYAGFDPRAVGFARVVVPATSIVNNHLGAHDFMSYGGSNWISPRSYVRLLAELHQIGVSLPPDRFCQDADWFADCIDDPFWDRPCRLCYTDDDCAGGVTCADVVNAAPVPGGSGPGEPTSSGDFLVVSGTVDDAGVAAIEPVLTQLLGAGPVGPGTGSWSIELRDAADAVLGKRSFEPVASETHGPGSEAPDELVFFELLPAPAGLDRIVVLEGARLAGELAASPAPPSVKIEQPDGGEVWVAGEPAVVSWTMSDPDPGDTLHASVHLSLDDGATWSALGVGLEGDTYAVHADGIAPSSEARVRVSVTDGLRTAWSVSAAPFEISPKPKQVRLLRPLGHGVHDAGEPLRLLGEARSLERGSEPVPLDGETLEFALASAFGDAPASAPGPEAELSLVSAIWDVTLELIAPGGAPVIATDTGEVWLSDALVELAPGQLADDDTLLIQGWLRLPSGALLVDKGAAQLAFALDHGARQLFDLVVTSEPGRDGFERHVFSDPGKGAELASLEAELLESAWLLSASLPAGTLPPLDAGTPDHARLMLRVGQRRYAGELGIDRDGDGWLDRRDNCPHLANDQADDGGVNTTEPDGVGNACQCGDLLRDFVVDAADPDLLRGYLGDPPSADLMAQCASLALTGACDAVEVVHLRRGLAGQSPPIAQSCALAQP